MRGKCPKTCTLASKDANRKARSSFGHEVPVQWHWIVGYKNHATVAQYVDNRPWGCVSNRLQWNCLVIEGFKMVKTQHKLVDDQERALRLQQTSVEELCEMIHRYCPPGGLLFDICTGTGRTGMAAAILGRRVLLNDRDSKVMQAGSRDVIAYMEWAYRECRLPEIGEEPVFDSEILMSAYYAHEVKSGGKVPPADDDEVVAKDSTPTGWARTMEELLYLGT